MKLGVKLIYSGKRTEFIVGVWSVSVIISKLGWRRQLKGLMLLSQARIVEDKDLTEDLVSLIVFDRSIPSVRYLTTFIVITHMISWNFVIQILTAYST